MAKKHKPLALNHWHARFYMEFVVYRDEAREWRWRLRHANGEVLAVSSEGYKRKSSCLRTVRNVQNRLAAAHIRVLDARTGRWSRQ